ncbi:MAG: amidohydrolase family protein [Phycisphaerales bacterium]|nr:amidohydrolase family protein [Phycisphaerales bacterium]
MKPLRCGLIGVAVATCFLASGRPRALAAPPEKVALTGARVIPVVGPDIDGATILIERGKIAAVGTDVPIPFDAMEIDCTGKVIMPGLIEPQSWRGLDIANESLPVAPFLDVGDAMDPSRLYFEDALRDGITSIHVMQGHNTVIAGMSRVVRPIGLTPDEMTVDLYTAIKMSASPRNGYDRMQQMATFRETFRELQEYIDTIAEKKYEDELEKDKKKVDVGPSEAAKRGREKLTDADYDDAHLNLMRLKRGDFDAWIYVGAPMDVAPAIALATEQGFLEHTILLLGDATFKAIGELKKAGRPVVLPEDLFYRERDPITGEISETFIPAKVHEAGLMFALQPNPNSSMAERYLTYQAALCVRNGIPRQTALESITLNPAKMLGMGDRLGSIEPGKTANLVIYSGDPLDFDSWVEQVYIDGIMAYDRNDDPRLAEILRLEDVQRKAEQAKKEAEEAAKAKEAEQTEPKPQPGNGEGAEPKPAEGGSDSPAEGGRERRRRGDGQ